MKAIGFKNFRKFKDFPILEFGDITIFVGGNNAGKSTVVKAIVTVLTFLKEAQFDILGNKNAILDNNFFFNKNPYAHIGTFKRALCYDADDNIIKFYIQIEELCIDIQLAGNRDDEHAVSARVQRLNIIDNRSGINFDFDFANNKVDVKLHANRRLFEDNEDFTIRYNNIKEIKDNLEVIRNRTFYKTRMFYNQYPLVEEDVDYSYNLTDICEKRMIGGPLISGLIFNVSSYMEDVFERQEYKKNKKLEPFYRISPYISRLMRRIDQLLRFSPVVEYLYAHSASQMVLYNSMETNDFLVLTIHKFASMRFPKNSIPCDFVRNWIREFNIGIDFEIRSIGGEAHTVDIKENGNKIIPLADKGMGSIQIMILLFRLAIDVYEKNTGRIQRNAPVTILVEEPEQNLHPKMQSKLMDFFHSVSEEYKIRFVIETHSEYLVRKSQLIVAEKKYSQQTELDSKCPIKVYYFPEEGVPREMKYNTNGRFQTSFDSGFFDESSNASLTLSRMERMSNH